jgi:hypothetical protein
LQRIASSFMQSFTCFLVPTKSTLPPFLTSLLTRARNFLDARERLVQVDDVNAVAGTENEAFHFRVPAFGLVAEVGTCFKQILQSQ